MAARYMSKLQAGGKIAIPAEICTREEFMLKKGCIAHDLAYYITLHKLQPAGAGVQAEWQLRAGPAWDNSINLVFTNELGGHVVRETIYRNFKRIVKGLGIEEARFHNLRHSYTAAPLQSGDDVKTVQEALGCATASFTLDIYGHVSERMKRESAGRMEGFIKGVSTL